MKKSKRKKRHQTNPRTIPKLARRNGQRVWVLRHKDHETRVKELRYQMEQTADPERQASLLEAIVALGAEGGSFVVIGLATTDRKVVLDPGTCKPIADAGVRPGDQLVPEDAFERALKDGALRRAG